MTETYASQVCMIDCIVTGRIQSPESNTAVEWLEAQPDVRVVRQDGFAETERFLSTADGTTEADLVVLFEQAPGDFPATAVDRLFRLRPLLRVVCCQGRWCESAGRTDPIWPEAVRISTRCAVPRLALELDAIQGQLGPLPLTAGRDEVFAFLQTPAIRFERYPVRVQVESDDVAWRMTVEEWFHAAQPGDAALDSEALRNTVTNETLADVVIVDLDPWSAMTVRRVAAIRQERPELAIVGVGHWLPDDVGLAEQLGIDAIVARLCPLWYLQAIATRAARLTRTP